MSKKILMLLDNGYNNDRRVFTEAETLVEGGFEVIVIATKEEDLSLREKINGVTIYRIFESDIFDIKNRKAHKNYALKIITDFEFDIVHAHDQFMLNLGAEIKKLKKNVKLVYDSHEMFHEWPLNISNFDNLWIAIKSYIVRRLMIYREKRNIYYVDDIITVNQSLSTALKDHFQYKKDIVFLRNLPRKNNDHTTNDIVREKLGISKDKRILIYIGQNVYLKTLNIEQVLLELKNQPNIEMVFICGIDTHSSKQVIEFTKKNEINNIHFMNRVDASEIITYLKGGDVGILATWNKKNKSYWYALGNKFFEYIQAGIPVLATMQPEHIPILEKYECGVLVNPDSSGAFIEGFQKIIANYDYFKQKTIVASNDLCWENEKQKLLNLYSDL
jgi:glycosyltransferase involved in cell wall biosynthesis